MASVHQNESFEEFKKSFSYGSRMDLNFKFLAGLSNEEASTFFQELLWKLGDAFVDGQFKRIVDHVLSWQTRAHDKTGEWVCATGPFTPLSKPVLESRLVLMASSGHFVEGDDPEPFGIKDMCQQEAQERIADFLKSEPNLSTIPAGVPENKLKIRHGGYDIRGAQADPNVVFPLEILLALAEEGYIGEVVQEGFSFVGACSQKQLLNTTGPEWVRLLQAKQADAAVLVPV